MAFALGRVDLRSGTGGVTMNRSTCRADVQPTVGRGEAVRDIIDLIRPENTLQTVAIATLTRSVNDVVVETATNGRIGPGT